MPPIPIKLKPGRSCKGCAGIKICLCHFQQARKKKKQSMAQKHKQFRRTAKQNNASPSIWRVPMKFKIGTRIVQKHHTGKWQFWNGNLKYKICTGCNKAWGVRANQSLKEAPVHRCNVGCSTKVCPNCWVRTSCSRCSHYEGRVHKEMHVCARHAPDEPYPHGMTKCDHGGNEYSSAEDTDEEQAAEDEKLNGSFATCPNCDKVWRFGEDQSAKDIPIHRCNVGCPEKICPNCWTVAHCTICNTYEEMHVCDMHAPEPEVNGWRQTKCDNGHNEYSSAEDTDEEESTEDDQMEGIQVKDEDMEGVQVKDEGEMPMESDALREEVGRLLSPFDVSWT